MLIRFFWMRIVLAVRDWGSFWHFWFFLQIFSTKHELFQIFNLFDEIRNFTKNLICAKFKIHSKTDTAATCTESLMRNGSRSLAWLSRKLIMHRRRSYSPRIAGGGSVEIFAKQASVCYHNWWHNVWLNYYQLFSYMIQPFQRMGHHKNNGKNFC